MLCVTGEYPFGCGYVLRTTIRIAMFLDENSKAMRKVCLNGPLVVALFMDLLDGFMSNLLAVQT